MRFGQHIAATRRAGELVVQPRMGFDRPLSMRQGLQAVRDARATAVGTITLDSYTRVGDLASAVRALREGRELNGYPIVSHGTVRTRQMLDGIQADDFPIQVRHGSALPEHIFAAVLDCGIDATEGGPISYCLPYGRTPLRDAISSWRRCADLAARSATAGHALHVETFGGCMLGQMCPPSMLVAISVLESVFFAQRGVPSVSLSYAQQTSFEQDVAAIRALRQLAARWLPKTDWHVVLYTYMGVFPRTEGGARDLLRQSVHIALRGGAERLIVKTVAEAHRIPTIEENVQAIELASQHWRDLRSAVPTSEDSGSTHYETVLEEASALVDAVLSMHDDVGEALRRAFAYGYLDIPFCLHRDNAGRTRAFVHTDGSLQWLRTGRLPIRAVHSSKDASPLNPHTFLQMLSTVEQRFDTPHLGRPTTPPIFDASARRHRATL
jgi:methylaspartate mutase epsilon subunit